MFTNSIIGEFVGEDEFKLLQDLTYRNNEIEVTAKADMVYDMASIPRIFWRVIGSPFIGKYRRAATIHDALYTAQGLGIVDKNYADKLFLEMMAEEGVVWWKRYVMYYAVKWFGASAWESIEENGGKYCEISFINSLS